MIVPSDAGVVATVRDQPGGEAWLADLPRLVAELQRDWELALGPAWLDGTVSWTAPAVDRAGRRVVLKVSWPHDEAAGEAMALAHWGGLGAVSLLRHDPDRWALLLERCDPGTALRDDPAADDTRLAVGAAVLRRLWDTPAPDPPPPSDLVPSLADIGGRWAALVEERAARTTAPHDRGLVTLGAGLLRDLPETAERDVLLHGDANPGNLLRSGTRWLAIDPKPMLGDPAYDPWPLLVQVGAPFEAADPAAVLRARYAAFGELTGLPVVRLLGWSVARTVEMALWEDHHGLGSAAAASMSRARVLADLLG